MYRQLYASHPVAPETPFYTIGQVAQVLSLQPAALRRLDEERIVSPDRSEGGQRRYTSRELDQLREVVALTNEGLTLPGIRQVLALRRRVEALEDELSQLKAHRAYESMADETPTLPAEAGPRTPTA